MTDARITIEVEVQITAGSYARAEPDVGIMYGWYEDIKLTWPDKDTTIAANEDQIQEALAEADSGGGR